MLNDYITRYIEQDKNLVDNVDDLYNNEIRVEAYKAFLNETDYVTIKIMEAQIQGGRTEDLIDNYSDILDARESAREAVDSLERLINDQTGSVD